MAQVRSETLRALNFHFSSMTKVIMKFFIVAIIVTVIFNKTTEAAPTVDNNLDRNNFIPRVNNYTSTTSVVSSKEDVKDQPFLTLDNSSNSNDFEDPVIVGGTEEETLEYQPSIILRCEAFGKTKPNVSWEYNGKPLANDLVVPETEEKLEGYEEAIININNTSKYNLNNDGPLSNNNKSANDDESHSTSNDNNYNSVSLIASDLKTDEDNNNNIIKTRNDLSKNKMSQVSWIDFRLPKLNLAFYGKFTCKAVNENGVITKDYEIIPNANSSVFMRLVRTSIALAILAMSAAFLHFCNRYRDRKKFQKYEKLPTQDLHIIRKFQNGIPEPMKKSEHTLKIPTCTSTNADESLDVSTTSLCTSVNNSTNNKKIEINSWVNYMAYDDRKDVLKEFFEIDLTKTLQNTDYGMLFHGKVRSPRTMKWKPVAVKTGKTERDNLIILEGLLVELKLLVSLTEECPFIVNLQAAYTKKLYKRQVYLFVDLCKQGTLDQFIDRNRSTFEDTFATLKNTVSNAATTASQPSTINLVSTENDENENSSPTSGQPGCSFSTKELVVWSAEIADGMRFLHKNKILHGNLCPENIFLTDKLVAKVGNIGHRVKVTEQDNTQRHSPECRLNSEYTNKSDVWSYGMTLWDIYSLRQEKSPSDQDLVDFYSVGNPLTSPKHSNKEIEEQINFCWNPDQNLRPDFGHLSDNFRRILNAFKP